MALKDGENALGKYGAAAMVGRDKNEIQIRIICGTDEEAKVIIDRILEDIRHRGQTQLVLGGTVDELMSSGKKT